MAINTHRVELVAGVALELIVRLRVLRRQIRDFVDFDDHLDIDWEAVVPPSYFIEDADGNLNGFDFSRQQMGQAIEGLDQVRRFIDNETSQPMDYIERFDLVGAFEDE